jgi:regulator of cell morphogenesis and NO signaling
MTTVSFSGDAKMADVLMANGILITILPYFGIELGFGEKTVEQVCKDHNVSMPLFLLTCNIYTQDYTPNNSELQHVSIRDVVMFLRNSHKSYLSTSIPQIIENLLDLAEHNQPVIKSTMIAFCDKYKEDVMSHIQYEEDIVFPYIDKLLAGKKPSYITINEFEESHRSIYKVLRDIRYIIIKYVPHTCSASQCLAMLSRIFMFERDLSRHAQLEELVLTPLIDRLYDDGINGLDSADLSERERQTLVALAGGMSNKEIADKMNISIHTVVSHRKNIIRKTGIKTIQGLTIYAFINNLITHKDLR